MATKTFFCPQTHTDLASRKRERRIMTASQVLCFSCIWMELNLRWMMLTMRSISLGEMGRVRDCSLSKFITWVVNSLHAWMHRQTGFIKRRPITADQHLQNEQKAEIGFWRGRTFTGGPWPRRSLFDCLSAPALAGIWIV